MSEPTEDDVQVKDFWEDSHGVNKQLWLTGSAGPEVWEYLNIIDKIKEGMRVLNIGIGLGYCTKELVNRKCKVQTLDISETASARVKNLVDRTWLSSELPSLPESSFDLAISNLVTQHMNNADLLEQMHYVVRSLSDNGIFAMQFAFRLSYLKTPDNQSRHSVKCGGVCRSLAEMTDLVEKARGKIVYANKISEYPHCDGGWFAIHIIKADSPVISTRNQETSHTFTVDGMNLLRAGYRDEALVSFTK